MSTSRLFAATSAHTGARLIEFCAADEVDARAFVAPILGCPPADVRLRLLET